MAYIDAYELSQSAPFQQKVMIAMLTAAKSVAAENGATTNHANRAALSKTVLNNPDTFVKQFTLAVVTNGAITPSSSDNDIQFTVNGLWDAFAGVA